MLPVELEGRSGPLLIMLHWLGGGAQTWREVAHSLAQRGSRFAALDFPGFGQAAQIPATDVANAVDAVVETIRDLRQTNGEGPWLLGGHSMGGKIAMAVARRALDGEPGLGDLRGLILTSPSTPSSEPIKDSRRQEHLDTLGNPTFNGLERHQKAEAWVDGNTDKLPLPQAIRARAVAGILAIPAQSYRAWFLQGSLEDWSDRIGTLALPARVIVGADETSLGEPTQREQTLPHLPGAELIVLEGTKHLAPIERPAEWVEHVTDFLLALHLPLNTPVQRPGSATEALMHSEHTSPATLQVMEGRLHQAARWKSTPEVFTPAEFRTLRALADIIVPDAGLDLAGCIDTQLAANLGDGWRYALLPPDASAWHRGLRCLDLAARHAYGLPFLSLHREQGEALLQQVARGDVHLGLRHSLHLDEAADVLTNDALTRWFEDVRAEFTRFYMADPRTMDRIGYTGFADDLGFTQIQLGQQEEFER